MPLRTIWREELFIRHARNLLFVRFAHKKYILEQVFSVMCDKRTKLLQAKHIN